MSTEAYGFDNSHSAGRGASLQKPFQIFVLTGDFLLILLSYLMADILHRAFMATSAEQEFPIGVGLMVGVVFVAIAFSQGVYDGYRLLSGVGKRAKSSLSGCCR